MILIAFVLLYLAIKKQFRAASSASDCIWYVPRKPAVG